MGWVFSMALFVSAIMYDNDAMIVASALFAVAGSLGNVGMEFHKLIKLICTVEEEE